MIAEGKKKVIEYTSFALKNCVFDVTQTDMPEDEIPSAYDNKHLKLKSLSEGDAQAIVQTVDNVSQDINVKLLSKFENWDKFNRVGIAKGFYSPIFIQAEDGIRDRNVTGVQTCALPI